MDEDEIPSIYYRELKAWGIPWCYSHLMRLVRAGEFPKPHPLSPRKQAWTPREIREWLERHRPPERDPNNESPDKTGNEKLPGNTSDEKPRKATGPDPVPDPVPGP